MDLSLLSSTGILNRIEQRVLTATLPNISSRYIQHFFSRNQAAFAAQLRVGLAQAAAAREPGWLFADRQELIHALKGVMLAADTKAHFNWKVGVGLRATGSGPLELRATNGHMAARATLRAAGGLEGLGQTMFTREDAARLVKLLGNEGSELVGLRSSRGTGNYDDLHIYGRNIGSFDLHWREQSVLDQFDAEGVWPRFVRGARVRVVLDREDVLLRLKSQEHWVPRHQNGIVRIGWQAEGGARILTMQVNKAPTALEFRVEGEWQDGPDFGLNLDYLKRALRSFTAARVEIAQEVRAKGKKEAPPELATVRIRAVERGEAEPEWVVMPVGL